MRGSLIDRGGIVLAAACALAAGVLGGPARAATSCTNVACGGCTPSSGATSTLIPAVSFPVGATTPIAFVDPRDFRGRRLVATQQGVILVWNTSTASFLATPFLDLRDDVGGPVNDTGGERGLLAMAADPDYLANGRLYVFYTASDGDVTVARYTRFAVDSDVGDIGSVLTILRIDHPAGNHNGGWMAFGPDGFLYITTGDSGGGCDDVNGNGMFDDPGELDGQRTNTLHGKMLRIDVRGIDPLGVAPDDCGVGPYNYTVPTSNPFVGQEPACDEVWLMGLRNPFRFSFDRLTGDVYIGDVGQNKWEEINLKRANVPAPVNFGWVCREGDETGNNDESGCNLANLTSFCPTDSGTTGEFPRAISGFWDPILCHHNGGWASIMGGYRYRGSMVPSVAGSYFYGDPFCGDLWKTTTLDPANPAAIAASCWASGFHGVFGFAEDRLGELYVVVGGAGRVDCIHDGAGCTWVNTDLFADGTETGTLARWTGGASP
jgi:glucose/arabinose dehydrogenase